MKVIICLLVGNFGQFEVIFLQYFHSWRKDRGEELCIGLDAVSINENQITLLHRHRLIVKVLHIAESKTCISGEDEEVAHPFQLSVKGIVAHFLQFGFEQRLALFAFATGDTHNFVRIARYLVQSCQFAHPFLQAFVVAIDGNVTPLAIVQPSVEGKNVLGVKSPYVFSLP